MSDVERSDDARELCFVVCVHNSVRSMSTPMAAVRRATRMLEVAVRRSMTMTDTTLTGQIPPAVVTAAEKRRCTLQSETYFGAQLVQPCILNSLCCMPQSNVVVL